MEVEKKKKNLARQRAPSSAHCVLFVFVSVQKRCVSEISKLGHLLCTKRHLVETKLNRVLYLSTEARYFLKYANYAFKNIFMKG